MLKTKPIQILAESTQTITLPSPKKISKTSSSNNLVNKNTERTNLQTANAMFDPNNASPNTEFMQLLKLRMNIYYEQEVSIFT